MRPRPRDAREVEVVAYDPRWPHQFPRSATICSAALDGVRCIAIEHVGSTSVPGLAAKPRLDIDVVVAADAVRAARAALEAAGYARLGDLGIPDRYAFSAPDDAPPRNVYVVVDGCLALRNHLAVRDVLRRDAALRDEYARHKLELAGATTLTSTSTSSTSRRSSSASSRPPAWTPKSGRAIDA